MIPRRKFLLSVLSIPAGSVLLRGQAKEGGFKPLAPGAYPSKQVIGKVTFAAVKYESDEETRAPFGKVNPNEYGILPVLFLIRNEGLETLMLGGMEVYLQGPDRSRIEPTPARDLAFLRPVKRPNTGPGIPVPIPLPKKKNPLASLDFETRAFAARTLLRGETAHGFFYFQARYRRDSILYINGIREGNHELFFAEIPLDAPPAP